MNEAGEIHIKLINYKTKIMEQIINSREAYDKYNSLLDTIVIQLQEYTAGEKIEFEEQGFEDVAGNDICGMDDENVYMEASDETYPLHELDILDAIKILGDLEAGVIKKSESCK